ncbi:MAG: hypothetical protein QM656_03430 [Paracoccaceae bacterium]
MTRKSVVSHGAVEQPAELEFMEILAESNRLFEQQPEQLKKASASYFAPMEDDKKPWETYI